MAQRTRSTEGRRLLRKYLGGVTQVALAARLRVRQQMLSAWVNGKCRPEHHFRLALERETGIPANAWFTARERQIAKAA